MSSAIGVKYTENNNTYKCCDAKEKSRAPCNCPPIRYRSNSCALKHRFGVRIHSDFSDEREYSPHKHDKPGHVNFCDSRIEIPSSPGRLRETSPTTQSEIIILDRPPYGHWPVKRSASLESRDNPFVPGGELSHEADDILQRAIIIRDKFILNEDKDCSKVTDPASSVTATDQSRLNDSSVADEEPLVSQKVSKTSVEPTKQNGSVEDSPKTPEPNQSKALCESGTKDMKKMKSKKCCSVM